MVLPVFKASTDRPNQGSDDNDRSEDSNSEPSVASKQAVVGLALSGMAGDGAESRDGSSVDLGCCLCLRPVVCVREYVRVRPPQF